MHQYDYDFIQFMILNTFCALIAAGVNAIYQCLNPYCFQTLICQN